MIYLLIEFLDELVFGVGETAWPLIRDDLQLSYTQIGIALSLPGLIAAFIEPFIGVLGDVWKRRALILIGGALFTLSLFLTSASFSFLLLISSFILFNPSSGAFVSLSQANLMDSDPARHEQNMARWTLAGSLGVLAGPILLGGFVHFGLGWRGTYFGLGFLSALCLILALRFVPRDLRSADSLPSFRSVLGGFRSAFQALKRKEVWRWLLLLEFADLMLDVLLSFLALYFVDVVQVSATQAGIAVTVWLALGLLTDLIFIPFIDKQPDSLRYLRLSAALEVVAFIAFLLAPGFWFKIVAVVFVNIFNTGWYPILKGRLYSALPGQSAAVMTIDFVTAPIAKSFLLLIGILADQFGLGVAIWGLLLGPLALLAGLPKKTVSNSQ